MKLILALAIIPLTISQAVAEVTVAKWGLTEKQIEAVFESDLDPQAKCDKYWSIIWPSAKTANLDARYHLYTILGRDRIKIIGRSDDALLKSRDRITLFIHSFGSDLLDNERRNYDVYLNLVESAPAFLNQPALASCMRHGLNPECTDIAVQQELIPSFEEFAAEIDLDLKNGASISCAN